MLLHCPSKDTFQPLRSTHFFRSSLYLSERFDEYEAVRGKFESVAEPDAPCVVIFTSGSTGKPKGVILPSYNLLNAAAVQVRMQRMTWEDRELLIVPLFHILGLAVCLLPCALTCTPLFIPDDIRTDTLIRAMSQERFTLAHAVPTIVIANMGKGMFEKADGSGLRCTMLAGARVDEAFMRKCRQTLPNNHFMIAYGHSEMAPISQTLYDDTEAHILHTVGKPLENIRIRIQDRETGEACPPGVPGEILVQGFNQMTGYYKAPLEDQAIDGEGWLHTGDMGSLDEDGCLRLSGRYKELIIHGGENIMPAEVEAAVSQLPAVREVKVLGVPSAFYGEEVAACVRIVPGAAWDEAEARRALSDELARFKIPSHFIVYDEFPMPGSGKIDGVALKEDAMERIGKRDKSECYRL